MSRVCATLFVICACAVSALAAPQTEAAKPAEFPLDAILTALQTQSAFRNKIDWKKVEPLARDRVGKAKSNKEKAEAIVAIFEQMNDVHSNLFFAGQAYSHYQALDEPTRQKWLAIMAKEREVSAKPQSALLGDDIGYILVPGMPSQTPEQIQEHAQALYSKVQTIAKKKPKAWIVDLRLNSGGNLYPMLLGLFPLLGEGGAGGTKDADDRLVNEWMLRKTGLYWSDSAGERLFATIDLKDAKPNPKIPVAVLLGSTTRSSGQALALAFVGREHTKLFGEPTAAGYTTVTAPVPIGEGAFLSLAVGFMTDRRGNPCKSQVLPDEKIEGGDAFEDLPADKKIQAASKWLTSHK